jgi:hypothetical protein
LLISERQLNIKGDFQNAPAMLFTYGQIGKERLKTNYVVKFLAAESPFAFFIVQSQVFIDILLPM